MKKILSLVLAVALMACTFAAMADTVSTPIVPEPKTFTVAVATNGYCLIPWKDKPFYQKLAEETNVCFEFNELNDWSQQTNLMIASDDMPDLFLGSIDNNMLNENLDMFWELTDMVNEYCPTLQELFVEEPSVLARLKSSDGGIYRLPMGFTLNLDNSIDTQYWINQDWLEAVGKAMPTNIEELEDVLIAFRDMDPNGNGQKDEIPFSFQQTGWAGKVTDLFGIFGVLCDTSTYVACDDEGVVYFEGQQDEFYQALVWLNHLASENLLDKESFSQTGDQFTAKLSQNIIGICAKYNPTNFISGYTPLGIILGPNEKTLFAGTNDSGAGNPISIAASCDDPETLVKLYEYVNSDFARRMSNRYGEEGVYWEFTGNGTEYILHDYDSQPPEGYEFWDQYVYTMGETGSSGMMFFSKAHLAQNVSPKTARETGILAVQAYFPTVEYHASAIASDLATEKNMLYTELDAYMQTFLNSAIFGTIDEGIWEAHLNELQKLKVDRYVELCQASYDAYLALIG